VIKVAVENSDSRLRARLEDELESATWYEMECEDVDTIYQKIIDSILLKNQDMPIFERDAQLQNCWLKQWGA